MRAALLIPWILAAPGADPSPAPAPAISLIATFGAGWRRTDTPPSFVAHDDPAPEGLTLQLLELGFAADVDRLLEARAFLVIPRLGPLEVDEAFLATRSRVRVKAGLFRSQFGRSNAEHAHEQDFARRPWTTSLLGDRGLRAPGVQVLAPLPLPWSIALAGELYTLSPNGAFADELSVVAALEQRFGCEPWSIAWGLSVASLDRGPDEDAPLPPADPERELLVGTDLLVRRGGVAFTLELVARRAGSGRDWDGTGYAQITAQVAPRWRAGARLDVVGVPEADGLAREYVGSASLAFSPSARSRLRVTYSREHDPSDSTRRNHAIWLQVEGAIGGTAEHPL